MPHLNYQINSGMAVGSPVDMRQHRELVAIGVPGVTSGDLYIQGALNPAAGGAPSSADFARLLETRTVGSGYLRFAVGPGSAWVPWPLGKTLPPWIRLEMSVAQAAPASLWVLTR